MLLSSEEPVVRQFLNAQRQGPIGMAEEKDADELAQEEAEGYEMPPLPPIPLQLLTSEGKARPTQREPGAWCRENNVTPPPGSFESTGTAVATSPGEADAQPQGTAQDGQTQTGRSPDRQPQDGRAQDGRAQDGRAQDGRAQDGRAQDGQAQDGRVRQPAPDAHPDGDTRLTQPAAMAPEAKT